MAKWIEFKKDYDDRPHKRQMVNYPKGTVVMVAEAVAERAINSGAAVAVDKPSDKAPTIKDAEFKG